MRIRLAAAILLTSLGALLIGGCRSHPRTQIKTKVPVPVTRAPADSLRSSLPPLLNDVELSAALADPAFPFGKPDKGSTPPYAVPFDTVSAVARAWVRDYERFPSKALGAKRGWKSVSEGPVIPYVDLDGNTVVYAFNFRVDGKPFPSNYWQAEKEFHRDESTYNAIVMSYHQPGDKQPRIGVLPKSLGEHRYVHVLASARYDLAPITDWREGLSDYYEQVEDALNKAKKLVPGGQPVLRRIYSDFPSTWFVFQGGDSVVVVAGRRVRWMNYVQSRADWRDAVKVSRDLLYARALNEGKDTSLIGQERLRMHREKWAAIMPHVR